MAERKAIPLRLDPTLYAALKRWADADLRSVNAQIEFLLRRSLQQAGRLPVRTEVEPHDHPAPGLEPGSEES